MPPASPKQAASRRSPLTRALDAELFKCLADPTRLRLLSCLAACRRACSVSEVAECCEVDMSVVSRHLSLLAEAGALASSKHGRTVLYHVRCDRLAEVFRALADAFEACSCGEGVCEPGEDHVERCC